jgi:hypothetical protein
MIMMVMVMVMMLMICPDDLLDPEPGLQGEDIDAQYCITYLRHDGKTLLAIQCPNREVFELWTDGLTAVIIGLRHSSRSETAATYNSGAEFTISSHQESKELFGQVSLHFSLPVSLSVCLSVSISLCVSLSMFLSLMIVL